ncbi:hypothetical protein A33M_2667 [Rhodovulum sp. PH10]|nr:hypothetical protein A33M_2667 [Rhodovulum sp. PH10]
MPGRVDAASQRRHHAQSRDDYTPHDQCPAPADAPRSVTPEPERSNGQSPSPAAVPNRLRHRWTVRPARSAPGRNPMRCDRRDQRYAA